MIILSSSWSIVATRRTVRATVVYAFSLISSIFLISCLLNYLLFLKCFHYISHKSWQIERRWHYLSAIACNGLFSYVSLIFFFHISLIHRIYSWHILWRKMTLTTNHWLGASGCNGAWPYSYIKTIADDQLDLTAEVIC